MSTKATKRPKKRQFEKDMLTGRDSYAIVGPSGEIEVRSQAVFALVRAQRHAEQAKTATTLTVERRTVLREPAVLYRVERDADGVVWTHTL